MINTLGRLLLVLAVVDIGVRGGGGHLRTCWDDPTSEAKFEKSTMECESMFLDVVHVMGGLFGNNVCIHEFG